MPVYREETAMGQAQASVTGEIPCPKNGTWDRHESVFSKGRSYFFGLLAMIWSLILL
jgi:hypothetical protein